jgi:phytoene dehydrogenase-like protein
MIFCEMNLLFPFHSQRTVDKKGEIAGSSHEFEQAFDNTLYNRFQGLVATRSSNLCMWSTTGLPGMGGSGAEASSVFLEGASGMSLERQRWKEPVFTFGCLS